MARVHSLVAWSVAVGILLAPLAAPAMDDYVALRARGMAGAMRGEATGDAALQLNPSGMSLARVYTVEGGYQLIAPNTAHAFHASVVDSSTSILAMGAFYTYRFGDRNTSGAVGHETGLAASIPFADRVILGGGVRYLWLDGPSVSHGFTFDSGLTVKILDSLTVGVAGRNLRRHGTLISPTLGYGVAFRPFKALLVAVDGEQVFVTVGGATTTYSSVYGGGEILLGGRVAVRLGGGREGARIHAGTTESHGLITAGVSLISEVGAMDVAFQQDLTGPNKLTFVGLSMRLFVPNPEATSAPSVPVM